MYKSITKLFDIIFKTVGIVFMVGVMIFVAVGVKSCDDVMNHKIEKK